MTTASARVTESVITFPTNKFFMTTASASSISEAFLPCFIRLIFGYEMVLITLCYTFNMKVILYMATTINGYIAKLDDDTSFISDKEWNSYSLMVRNAGCLIVGHRTYNILTKQTGFSEFGDVKIVILSHKKFKTLSPNHFVANSPKESLVILKDYDNIIVAGGSILNASFIKEQLIDEIYLDIEPTILGQGIPLFDGGDFEINLDLIDIKKLSENETQLHYKII